MIDVDALAQEIRRIDGKHSLGAGELAEALMPFLASCPMTEPENQAEALKPCPFCGGNDARVSRGAPGGFFVWHKCGWGGFASEMFGYRFETEAEAVAAWNRRASLPEVPAVPVGVTITQLQRAHVERQEENGIVRVEFGKPVAWLGLPPPEARQLAALLLRHAERSNG